MHEYVILHYYSVEPGKRGDDVEHQHFRREHNPETQIFETGLEPTTSEDTARRGRHPARLGEVAERIQIPGKHVVNFTLVENRSRGEKRLDKGTVLLFSAPRITYVRQSDKSETEQTINLYADADNFKIVAGAGVGEGAAGSGAGEARGGDMFAPAAPAAAAPARVSQAVPRGGARGATNLSGPDDAGGLDDTGDTDDPFAEYEPAPLRSGATLPAPVPSAGRPAPGRPAQSAPAPRPGASRPAARCPIAPPPVDEDDMADLSDPFADGGL